MSVSNVSYIPNGVALPSAQRIDNQTTTVYIGNAPIGSLDAQAVWSIKRLTVGATSVVTEWANGNDANTNVWSNRASLSYS